jgi:hypothetical protein
MPVPPPVRAEQPPHHNAPPDPHHRIKAQAGAPPPGNLNIIGNTTYKKRANINIATLNINGATIRENPVCYRTLANTSEHYRALPSAIER